MKKTLLCFTTLLCMAFSISVSGQWIQQGSNIYGNNQKPGAAEGQEVALSADGKTMASLCGYNHSRWNDSLCVIMYRLAGGQWRKQTVIYAGLTDDDGQNYRSCLALSADGNTLALNDGEHATISIYTYEGTAWRLQQKLPSRNSYNIAPYSPAITARQSIGLSYDGNTLIFLGQIFERANGVWSVQATLAPLDRTVATVPDWQGYRDTANHFSSANSAAISADGNTAVVYDSWSPDTTFDLWVFTRSGTTWTQQGSRLEPIGHQQWYSLELLQVPQVSISGDGNTIAANATMSNGYGRGIWVFNRQGTVWTEQDSGPMGSTNYYNASVGGTQQLSYDGNSFISADANGIYYWKRNAGVWRHVGGRNTFLEVDTFESIGHNDAGSGDAVIGFDSSGTKAIIGSSFFKYNKGGEWYFTLSDTTFVQTGPGIYDSIPAGGSYMGYSTAMSADGSTIAAGGYMDGNYNGAVWIYARNGLNWQQLGPKLTVPDTSWNPRTFGFSVALSGNGSIVAVGAPYENNFSLPISSNVYIYKRTGNAYVPQVDSLTLPGVQQLGRKVSISADGNTLLATMSDSAVVWVYNGNAWTVQKIFSGYSLNDAAISGDGNTIVFADPSEAITYGGIDVFYRTGTTWTQQAHTLCPASVTSGYSFPGHVAVSYNGNYVAASGDNLNSSNGQIYSYVRTGSTWAVRDSIIPTGGNYLQHGNGVAVSITGDTVVEIQTGGVSTYNTSGINIFSRTSGHWVLACATPSLQYQYYESELNSLAASSDAKYFAVGIGQTLDDLDGKIQVFKASALIDTLLINQSATCAQVANGQLQVKLTGGTQPYTYIWSNGGNSATNTGLTPGNYSVTMFDNSGDTIVRTYIVGSTTNPMRSGFTYTFNCTTDNGTIQVTSAGGTSPYTYVWNTLPVQNTSLVTNLAPGFYSYVATDANGCTYSDSADIPATPYSVNISGTQPQCINNGTATITMAGGTNPLTYIWSNAATTGTISNLGSGTYTATVTDADGCIVTGSIALNLSCNSVIEGAVFFDKNGDCIQDNGETPAQYYTLRASNNSYTVYGSTDLTGKYNIVVPGSGNFDVSIASHSCNYQLCQGTSYPIPVVLAAAGDTANNINFPVINNGFDLFVQAQCPVPFPGSSFNYTIYYGDLQDSVVPTGIVTLNYDTPLIVNYTTPLYSSIDTNNHIITWDVTNIGPAPLQSVSANFTVPATTRRASTVYMGTSVAPVLNDCNDLNNYFNLPVLIGGSYDPNSKTAYPANVIYVGDSIITYTIHFQNTGVDSTHFVEVIDTLSDLVDPANARTIATSHQPYTFSVVGKGILDWKFNPLALPDSGTNFANSQGFITYQVNIKPNLTIGTQINNSASIYFDYNAPVVTDTTINVVTTPSAIANISKNYDVKVYPNPFSNYTNFIIPDNIEKFDIKIYDLLGRSVNAFTNIRSHNFIFNRNSLATGCYIYRVISNNEVIGQGKIIAE